MELRSGLPEPAVPTPSASSWRVSPPLAWAKIAAVVAFALVALIYRDAPTRAAAAGFGAVVLAVYAARDLIAPVRLAADHEGVTVVTGYARRRRLSWAEVERVRIDEHTRLGLRTEMLEIDAGDAIYLFSTYDLNAPCSDVAEALLEIGSIT
jgi:hypothetical protein